MPPLNVVLIGTARGSMHWLIGLPRESIDWQVLSEIRSLGNSKYHVVSITAFDSLDLVSQETWRSVACDKPPVRERDVLRPAITWEDALEATRKSQRTPHTIPSERAPSAYDVFISPENFRLAWERVRYFDRPDSRDWIGLKAFAANRDHDLEVIRHSIIERTFEPSYPEIRYLPKSSHTLRPMAVLSISDRVVFQAIANVISERSRPALSVVANRQSFANVLTDPGQKPLFIHWKRQYRLFQEKFCELIEEGNLWVAETDVAAFYETIDHAVLFNGLIEDRFLDERTLEYLKAYLPVWASVQAGGNATRGVPQGCLSSDLLANIFLHGFDQDLASQEYHYMRYVDDIRLLARTREAVQRGLIRIDRSMKTKGLLLQTKKTTVRQVIDISEEVDRMAAQLSEIDTRLNEPDPSELLLPDPLFESSLHDVAVLGEDFAVRVKQPALFHLSIQDRLLELFWQAKHSIDSNSADPFAERHLRFCLWRLRPNPAIVNAILPYLVERPWLGESIYRYLQQCKGFGKNKTFQLREASWDVNKPFFKTRYTLKHCDLIFAAAPHSQPITNSAS